LAGPFFRAPPGPSPVSSQIAEQFHARLDEGEACPPRAPPPARSEIAGNTSYFPIAVAHWLGTVAAIDFLAGRELIQCAEAAALFGLGERPPRRLAEFAAARAGKRVATCLVFRPLHLHPPGAGVTSGAHPHAPGFHSRRILAHMLGKVQLFVLGERHDRRPQSLSGVSNLTASPRPPADRRHGRKVSNGRPNQLASGESRGRESEQCPGLAARLAAAAILNDIVARCHPLDECFSGTAILSRLGGLEPRDIALTRSIVTVALRRLGTIRAALDGLLEKGLPRQAAHLEWTLIVASAQILFLDVPDHAAVDLAVRMTRLEAKNAPYASLVNGVLRNLIRTREKILLESDPLDHDTPAWLAERWRKTYGEAGARAIATAHRQEPVLDLTVLSDPSIWAERLGATVLPTGSLRLWTHMPVTGLPGFSEGRWFVQDAAAALPARLLRVGPGTRVADFCAAPGGKAAQLAAAGAEVTAIDRSAERLKKLAANFTRLNLRASIVVADIVNFKTGPFDAILVDAPCLATGTIRRHPDIAWIKKPRDIVALTALQTRLLDKAVELVKPGGMIVYCTCSIEPEENEMQIAALLRRNPGVMRVPIEPGEVGDLPEVLNENGELRTLPSHLPAAEPRLSGLDGFFAARLLRRG
jgi:16S rRNA (cytosine967-C5)-methyltransferase